MKNLISKQLLAQVRNNNLNESVRLFSQTEEKRKRSKRSNEISVFLSHKHDEKEIILQATTLLEKLGIEVYLDWQDGEMPKNTNGSTARIIKEKIRQHDKFIFLATEAAINSKWCNWELGYGDSHKYSNNIAIMPIADTENNQFSGNEYLQIYPSITSEYSYVPGTYYVEFENSRIKLEDWLKKK